MSRDEFHILQDRSAGFISRLIAYALDLALVAGIVVVGGLIASLMARRLAFV